MAESKDVLVIDLNVVRGAAALDLQQQLFKEEMERAIALVEEFVGQADARAAREEKRLRNQCAVRRSPGGSARRSPSLRCAKNVTGRLARLRCVEGVARAVAVMW